MECLEPGRAVKKNTRLAYSTGGETPPSEDRGDTNGSRGKSSSGIRLRLERRASGRVVTVVSGLPGPGAETAALARHLKAACGAGGTFKNDVLELQGDHRDRVETELQARGLRSKRAGG